VVRVYISVCSAGCVLCVSLLLSHVINELFLRARVHAFVLLLPLAFAPAAAAAAVRWRIYSVSIFSFLEGIRRLFNKRKMEIPAQTQTTRHPHTSLPLLKAYPSVLWVRFLRTRPNLAFRASFCAR
jgi:hypothetical protein